MLGSSVPGTPEDPCECAGALSLWWTGGWGADPRAALGSVWRLFLGNEKGRYFSSIQRELRQAVGSGLMTAGRQCGGRCSENGRRTFRCVAVRVYGDKGPLTCEGTSTRAPGVLPRHLLADAFPVWSPRTLFCA